MTNIEEGNQFIKNDAISEVFYRTMATFWSLFLAPSEKQDL